MPVFTMVSQVVVLFLLMGLGYGMARCRLLEQKTCQQLTWLLCYIVMPCLVLNAFQVPYSPVMFHKFLLMFVITIGIHGIYMILSRLMFNSVTLPGSAIVRDLKFTSIYSNCGFMGVPLLSALLGQSGLFYGSVYIAVYGLIVWSHGLLIYTGNFNRQALVRVVLNPNIIAALIGFLFYFFSWRLPLPVYDTVRYIANLNTALSMMVIGAAMTQISLRTIWRGWFPWLAVLMRNLVMPLITLAILYGCGLRGELLLCCMILASCPIAGLSVLFAQLTGRDPAFACQSMTISTLCSLVSLPVVLSVTVSLA